MFIQYLAKQGYKGAQKDRRKNLQYKDLGVLHPIPTLFP